MSFINTFFFLYILPYFRARQLITEPQVPPLLHVKISSSVTTHGIQTAEDTSQPTSQ